ncbi:MAG: hypothetical protein DCC52_13470, partial [Chloroflexi bacterium]
SGRKGDGIRLWASPRAQVENNHVHNARDMVIWYSEGVRIVNNFIETGRYGVHLMYCDGATIENNRLLNNSVGIYTMYSKNVDIQNNDVRGQRGPSGYALGFKDADNVAVQRNLLVDNRGGIFLDGTPRHAVHAARICAFYRKCLGVQRHCRYGDARRQRRRIFRQRFLGKHRTNGGAWRRRQI